MSDSNPLLGKADALMQKHRAPVDVKPEPSAPTAWLPVLTEVVTRGIPPSASGEPPVLTAAPIAADDEAERLVKELTPKLTASMEKQVAAELRKTLDETVATLLSQLDVNVREIVRDAVTEKLRAHKLGD